MSSMTNVKPQSPWRATGPSIFAKDPAFNGRYSAISKRTTASADKQPVILPGSINPETRADVQAKRWKLLGARK